MVGHRAPEIEIDIPSCLKRIEATSLNADDEEGPFFANAVVATGMVHAIRSGGEAAPSFAQALHVQQVVEAVEQSSSTRAWVRIDEI